jgi:DNA polymerase (family 10)
MKILNPGNEDYHVHTITFSDGWNTVDEMVRYAGDIGLKKMALCDHSQALLTHESFGKKTARAPVKRWENVFNNVEVIFGVEADLLNEAGDTCMEIDGVPGDFIILSHHKELFQGTSRQIAKGFVNAINRFHDKINCIGHVCVGMEEADAKKVILAANKLNIPLELNAKYFVKNPKTWNVLLENADRVYINSDAHLFSDLKNLRAEAFMLLKEMKQIN